MWNNKNTFLVGKLGEPSPSEGGGVLKVWSELFDQLSTRIRPNKRYKTDRPGLDGSGFDIHSAIGKLPAPKRGWTLPAHNYTGLYNPLEQQLKYNPGTGQIRQIYQQPTGATHAITMQHDVDYGENEKHFKHKADQKKSERFRRRSVETKAVGTCGSEERN